MFYFLIIKIVNTLKLCTKKEKKRVYFINLHFYI